MRWYRTLMFVVAFGIVTVSLWVWLTPTEQSISPHKPQTTVPKSEKEIAPLRTFGSQLPTDLEALKTYPETSPNVTRTLTLLENNEHFKEYFQTPEGKRFLDIWTSQEFYEFEKTDPNTKETDAFWAKHGFPNDPDRFMKRFREEFPTGEPEDFEPEIRAKFEKLFADIPPDKYLENVHGLMEEFMSDERNNAWLNGYFQGDSLGSWGEAILENLEATYPQRMGLQPPTDIASQRENDIFLERDPLLENDANREVTTSIELPTPTDITSFSPSEIATEESKTLSPVIRDPLEVLGVPDIPTDESLEGQLREQLNPERFSPQRLNTAMQTLNQYGPEEGLRRLKNSDPEVAQVIERHIGQQQSSNKQ